MTQHQDIDWDHVQAVARKLAVLTRSAAVVDPPADGDQLVDLNELFGPENGGEQ